MAVFVIGDVQGCCDELELLISALRFNADKDQLWFVGDLVNRGPQSLETLRLVKSLGSSAICVLGNHDLHLLALAHNPTMTETGLHPVLQADDRDELINWLISRPMAHYDEQLDTLLVHAGIAAEWSVDDALKLAGEVERTLQSELATDFLTAMYGNKPTYWADTLAGMGRLRFISNCLTRIRYCTRNGELNFDEKQAPGKQAEGLLPWFDLPDRVMTSRIAFGHWSTLGLMQRQGLLAVDTGCVWGGSLTAVRLDAEAPPVQVTSRQPRCFNNH